MRCLRAALLCGVPDTEPVAYEKSGDRNRSSHRAAVNRSPGARRFDTWAIGTSKDSYGCKAKKSMSLVVHFGAVSAIPITTAGTTIETLRNKTENPGGFSQRFSYRHTWHLNATEIRL